MSTLTVVSGMDAYVGNFVPSNASLSTDSGGGMVTK